MSTVIEVEVEEITNEIISEIGKITDVKRLCTINSVLCQRIKELRRRIANSINWYVGQKVVMKLQYQNTFPFSQEGVVTKVNNITLKVTFGDKKYKVAKSMLNVV